MPRLLIALFGCLLLVAPTGIGQSSSTASERRMSFHNRLLLNRAAVSGLRELEVLLLAAGGRLTEAAARIERLGGRVRRDEPSIGYLRALVPTDKLVAIVDDASIEAYQIASLSRGSWYRDGPPQANADMYREFERVIPSVRPAPEHNADLPLLSVEESRHPGYTADDDAGVGAWLERHPTFDGRGVTIAILEPAQIEFSHPMLGAARSLDGRDVPKLAGILNTLDEDALDDTRVRLDTEILASTAWNRVGDRTYALPRPGSFRFGIFVVPVAINLIQQFGVLVDPTTREIWVDTNGDADFRDESVVPDVNERFAVRFLKLTYPEPFEMSFVAAHGRANSIHLYVAKGGHHTMTTSVAAGAKTSEGLAYGVAPGARVLLVRENTVDYRVRDVLEGFLAAAQRLDVDIVSASQGLVIVPDTEADFAGQFIKRIIATYRKPIFVSAGNMQLYLNNVIALGDAFAVGGSIGPATHATLFGGMPIEQLMVHPIGAAGPAIDGALKPDFLAPMQRLAADVYLDRTPLLIPTTKAARRLPPGYQISCCTSASAPYAAGVGALLLSAAKQEGIPYSLPALQRALRIGAQFLDEWPAHQQGNGVLDVEGAWRELRRAIELPTIRATASVVHPLARYAARANDGPGLFERDGWTAGMSGARAMRFRRESGGRDPIAYRLSWTGNDGTFSTQPSVTLPMHSDVNVPIRVAARTNGAHSAILNLHDPVTDAVLFRTQATVVAADRLNGNRPSITVTGSLSALRRKSHYIDLPADVGAVHIALEVRRGAVEASIIPSHSLYPNYYGHVYPLGGRTLTPGTYHVVLPNPAPGVWTVQVGNLASQRVNRSPVPGEAAAYAVTIRQLAASLQQRRIGPDRLAIRVENRGAAPQEPAVETSLGTLRSHAGEVFSSGLPSQFDIDVPEAASTLSLNLASTDAAGDEFELHLYDCTSGECFSYDFTMPAASKQRIVVRQPKAGRWVAAVNAAPFPTKSGSFVLEEIIAGAVRTHDSSHRARPFKPTAWTEEIALPAPLATPDGTTPIMLVELIDAAVNREEIAQPWETRDSPMLWNLAGRRPAIATAVHRLR